MEQQTETKQYLRLAITDSEAAQYIAEMADQDRCSMASLVARLVVQEYERRQEQEQS